MNSKSSSDTAESGSSTSKGDSSRNYGKMIHKKWNGKDMWEHSRTKEQTFDESRAKRMRKKE